MILYIGNILCTYIIYNIYIHATAFFPYRTLSIFIFSFSARVLPTWRWNFNNYAVYMTCLYNSVVERARQPNNSLWRRFFGWTCLYIFIYTYRRTFHDNSNHAQQRNLKSMVGYYVFDFDGGGGGGRDDPQNTFVRWYILLFRLWCTRTISSTSSGLLLPQTVRSHRFCALLLYYIFKFGVPSFVICYITSVECCSSKILSYYDNISARWVPPLVYRLWCTNDSSSVLRRNGRLGYLFRAVFSRFRECLQKRSILLCLIYHDMYTRIFAILAIVYIERQHGGYLLRDVRRYKQLSIFFVLRANYDATILFPTRRLAKWRVFRETDRRAGADNNDMFYANACILFLRKRVSLEIQNDRE